MEQDDEDIDHEAVRQKEYLERVVASQKHQLKQMEKLHKLTHSKMVNMLGNTMNLSWTKGTIILSRKML